MEEWTAWCAACILRGGASLQPKAVVPVPCLFAENTIDRAGGLDIRSRHGRLVRTLGVYGLPCSFRGNTGTSRDTSVASGVRPRRGAERPGGAAAPGRSYPGVRSAADGHKCAGWTDPDRAPPACELYNSLGGLRNIPLSFSACCVTGNALLRPSERPPARTPGTARTGSAARAPRQSLSYATHSHINSMPVVRRHLP